MEDVPSCQLEEYQQMEAVRAVEEGARLVVVLDMWSTVVKTSFQLQHRRAVGADRDLNVDYTDPRRCHHLRRRHRQIFGMQWEFGKHLQAGEVRKVGVTEQFHSQASSSAAAHSESVVMSGEEGIHHGEMRRQRAPYYHVGHLLLLLHLPILLLHRPREKTRVSPRRVRVLIEVGLLNLHECLLNLCLICVPVHLYLGVFSSKEGAPAGACFPRV